jgi:hypothetical protein
MHFDISRNAKPLKRWVFFGYEHFAISRNAKPLKHWVVFGYISVERSNWLVLMVELPWLGFRLR